MWRKLLRTLRALTYLGALGLLSSLVAYVAFSQFVRRGVTPTPDLTRLDETEASTLLAHRGLRLAWQDDQDRYDEDVPEGRVLEQKPRAGTLVKRGSLVTAMASRGPQRMEVPVVVGEAAQAAEVTLAAAGLRLGRTVNVFSRDDRDGIVVGQQPPAGARVEPHAPVDLFLSLKSTAGSYLMPDLVGKSYDTVRRVFERNGFRFGRVAYRSYEGRAAGEILRQFPAAGHPLRRGEVISLTVVTEPVLEQPVPTVEPTATR